MNLFDKFQHRNYWLVVKVRARELKVPIVIPVPLFLIEDILEALTRVYKMGRHLFPQLKEHTKTRLGWHDINIDIDDYIDFPVEVIRELRSLGKFTLVEVNDEAANVSIKLY